ncbi:MAG: cyclic nucleotide-binding domain-containing protein [Coriobacteriia bacterium]|nr:cyclic nucleotide-binding domain-containing protein [Coriobacteriia bacterium]
MAELTGILGVFADGDTVFEEGDAAADMYVVRSGAVEIVRERDGARTVLERVEPGGFFGEMALFSPGVRSASAVACGETHLEAIDTPTFQAYLDDPIIWTICAKLSERVRRATAWPAEGDPAVPTDANPDHVQGDDV